MNDRNEKETKQQGGIVWTEDLIREMARHGSLPSRECTKEEEEQFVALLDEGKPLPETVYRNRSGTRFYKVEIPDPETLKLRLESRRTHYFQLGVWALWAIAILLVALIVRM